MIKPSIIHDKNNISSKIKKSIEKKIKIYPFKKSNLIIEYILREFLVLSKNIKVLIFILVPSARLELALRKRQGF